MAVLSGAVKTIDKRLIFEKKSLILKPHLIAMETKTKPKWITKEQWTSVPSIDWWEDSKKRMEYISQSKPLTPEEALAQTMRLRNSKNWKLED